MPGNADNKKSSTVFKIFCRGWHEISQFWHPFFKGDIYSNHIHSLQFPLKNPCKTENAVFNTLQKIWKKFIYLSQLSKKILNFDTNTEKMIFIIIVILPIRKLMINLHMNHFKLQSDFLLAMNMFISIFLIFNFTYFKNCSFSLVFYLITQIVQVLNYFKILL